MCAAKRHAIHTRLSQYDRLLQFLFGYCCNCHPWRLNPSIQVCVAADFVCRYLHLLMLLLIGFTCLSFASSLNCVIQMAWNIFRNFFDDDGVRHNHSKGKQIIFSIQIFVERRKKWHKLHSPTRLAQLRRAT